MKKQINVVGAVIVKDGQILCAQRGAAGSLPGLWEFPGGKIEPGETAPSALEREIVEELDCRVNVGDELTTTRHDYDFGIVNLTTFFCELVEGTPTLREHAEVRWVFPEMLTALDWAPADMPAVNLISSGLTNGG